MTIIEAINKIDALKPNSYGYDEKVRLLNMLDSNIYEEVIKTHHGANIIEVYEKKKKELTENRMTAVREYALEHDCDIIEADSHVDAVNTSYATLKPIITAEHPELSFSGYDSSTAPDTKLLVGLPYDSIYIYWLEAQIDYMNAEYARYNNSITRFNDLYTSWMSFYNRTHMPKGIQARYF